MKVKKKSTAHERHNSGCSGPVELQLINSARPEEVAASIIMLETSGHGWLYAR